MFYMALTPASPKDKQLDLILWGTSKGTERVLADTFCPGTLDFCIGGPHI